MDSDGTNQRQLTSGLGSDQYGLAVSPDGRYIFFTSNRGGISRIDIDGGNPKQLSNEGQVPTCSPDGKWVIYVTPGSNRGILWKVATDGGDAVQVTNQYSDMVPNGISPDGKLMAVTLPESKDRGKIGIVLPESGELVRTLDLTRAKMWPPRIQWTPDSRAITYIFNSDLWSQPINGGSPVQLTNFNQYFIQSFAWSPDGRQLVCARGFGTNDVVLLSNFR